MVEAEIVQKLEEALKENEYVVLRENVPDEWDDRHAFAKIEKHAADLHLLENGTVLTNVYVIGEPTWNGANWALDNIEVASSVADAFQAVKKVGYFDEADFDIDENYPDYIWEVDDTQCQCDVCILPKGRWR